MKKTIFIAALLLLIQIGGAMAQQPQTTRSMMKGEPWRVEILNAEKYEISLKFTDTKMMVDRTGENERKYDIEYYLTDAIPETFDDSQIGKNENGKYYVIKRKNDFLVMEILELTDKVFRVKIANDPIAPVVKYFRKSKS